VRLLLVEDDAAIAVPLIEGLKRHGLEVTHVATSADVFTDESPDIVLLDLALREVDGLEVCRHLRRQSTVPIIVVGARGEEAERVLGLQMGADDYLVKPFSMRELVSRIDAVSRRAATGPVRGTQTIGALSIDRRSRRVTLGPDEVRLTPREFDLLALIADDPGAAVSRSVIMSEVWDPHWYGPTRTLDVHVATLRRKLGSPDWIEAIRHVGYRLVAPK
jgi:two-component system response regulator RegX3